MPTTRAIRRPLQGVFSIGMQFYVRRGYIILPWLFSCDGNTRVIILRNFPVDLFFFKIIYMIWINAVPINTF